MNETMLDNQHLEYSQFFEDHISAENQQKLIEEAENTKEILRVMAEHKGLIQKVNIN